MKWNRGLDTGVVSMLILALLLGNFVHAVLANDQVDGDQTKEGQKQPIALADEIPPAANRYELVPTPLQANGPIEESTVDTLVRIRGVNPKGDQCTFEVLFGPAPDANGPPGRGQFTNADPTWDCVQGYALLRGIRPSGSTQYVKATSDSTTIILFVDDVAGEHRVIVTEAKIGAKVWLKGGKEPDKPNVMQGHVIIATIVGGVATLGEPILIAADPVSCNLVNELSKRENVNSTGGLDPVDCDAP